MSRVRFAANVLQTNELPRSRSPPVSINCTAFIADLRVTLLIYEFLASSFTDENRLMRF